MRSASLRTLSHLTEYAALRLLELAFTLPPRRVALHIGALLGLAAWRLGFRSRIVKRNMEHVALWQPQEARRIMRRLYRTMGRYIAELLRVHHRLPPYHFAGADAVSRAQARGKGTIAVLAHFGNWEMLATIFGPLVPQMHVVAMPMRNPWVQRWLAAKRANTGVVTVYRRNAVRAIYRALTDNRVIALLIDQNARRHGTMVPFLGREASTVRTAAGLLQRTGCSILLAHALLREDGCYEIVAEEGRELGIDPSDEEAFVAAYQKEHNDVLSRWIRRDPEHYFGWFHRRFGQTIAY